MQSIKIIAEISQVTAQYLRLLTKLLHILPDTDEDAFFYLDPEEIQSSEVRIRTILDSDDMLVK